MAREPKQRRLTADISPLIHFQRAGNWSGLTSLRTKCYDPAGVGCYGDFGLWTSGFGLYPVHVSHKSACIAARIESFCGQELDAHYLGYFDCFNRQLFYEAHEVLEDLWLKDKSGPNGAFYKGLIQLAGAFVHLQKNRPQPAAALFKLALANLEKYPYQHERLDVATACGLIRNWLGSLEAAHFEKNPLTNENQPKLALEPSHC